MSKIKTQKLGVSFSGMFGFTQVRQLNNKITKQKLHYINVLLIGQLQACEGNGNLENCALLRYNAASSVNYLQTLLRNDRYSLRNSPEEPSSHLLRGGTRKSRSYLPLASPFIISNLTCLKNRCNLYMLAQHT